jgi:enoyl-CoA hydratase/carnithine racemase
MPRARRLVRSGAEMCAAWEKLRPMTIAVIHGAAIGGGLSLAVSCDFRVMAADAFVRAPEIELGINYSWNSLPRIGNLVGPARAKLIGALARRIDAETALAWGLCEAVTEPSREAAVDTALELAREIASKPRLAVQMAKESVNRYFAAPNTVNLDQDQILLMARDPATIALQEATRARFRK